MALLNELGIWGCDLCPYAWIQPAPCLWCIQSEHYASAHSNDSHPIPPPLYLGGPLLLVLSRSLKLVFIKACWRDGGGDAQMHQSGKAGCTVGQHPWVVCCRLVIIVSEYSTGWLRIAPLFKRAIQESRSCGTFIYQIRRSVIGEWPLFCGTMGGKRWYGGNIWARMTTPGIFSKTQEVGWRFKAFLMFRFGIGTSSGPFQLLHHSITDFHFNTSQHQIQEDPAGECCSARKAPKGTRQKNINSIWCQVLGFGGAHWFLWSCWCSSTFAPHRHLLWSPVHSVLMYP